MAPAVGTALQCPALGLGRREEGRCTGAKGSAGRRGHKGEIGEENPSLVRWTSPVECVCSFKYLENFEHLFADRLVVVRTEKVLSLRNSQLLVN